MTAASKSRREVVAQVRLGVIADALAALRDRLAPKPRLVPIPIPIPVRRPRR